MNAVNVSQGAFLIFWFALAMLIFVLALIARFYEHNGGRTTFYRWYAAPVMLLGLASVRYVSLSQWGGDVVADSLMFSGGAVLLALCLRLYYSMTHGRRDA
jgi:hypothetical protein